MFDPNEFLNAIIEAYKMVKGRKLDPMPYPVHDSRGKFTAQAPWLSGGYRDNVKLNNHQPLVVTRAEFLEKFLEVYDCGEKANELIRADIEGMKQFEW